MEKNLDYELVFDDDGQVEVDYDKRIVRYDNKNGSKEYTLKSAAASQVHLHLFMMRCLLRKGQMELATV